MRPDDNALQPANVFLHVPLEQPNLTNQRVPGPARSHRAASSHALLYTNWQSQSRTANPESLNLLTLYGRELV